jgi:hypothetical protein
LRKIIKTALVVGALAAGHLTLATAASAEPAAFTPAAAAAPCKVNPKTRYVDLYCRNTPYDRFRVKVVCKNTYDKTKYTVWGPWRTVGGGSSSRGNCGSDGKVVDYSAHLESS